jgi:hypothetical protein
MNMPSLVEDLLAFLDFSRIVGRKATEICSHKSPARVVGETKAASKCHSYVL